MSKENLILKKSEKIFQIIQFPIILYWLMFLRNTNALYVVYLVVGISAIFALFKRNDRHMYEKVILAFILSVFVTLGNYDIYSIPYLEEEFSQVFGNSQLLITYVKELAILKMLLLFFSSWVTFLNFLTIVYALFGRMAELPIVERAETESKKSRKIFCKYFFIIAVVYLAMFFLAFYPGVLGADALDQLNQICTENVEYNNHHPICHTLLIRCFFDLGYFLSGDVNTGVACYTVFQCLFMAFSFAFTLYTLYEEKVSDKVLNVVLCFYAFAPYHWNLASTVLKDVVFAGATLILVTAFYRIRRHVGNSEWMNYVLLVFGGIMSCLMRHNGYYAFVAFAALYIIYSLTCAFLAVIKQRENSKKWLLCAVLILICFTCSGLEKAAVRYTAAGDYGIADSLSIPLQQIARVIVDGKQIDETDINLINRVMDIDKVTEVYEPYISDPIKKLVYDKKGNQVIEGNIREYLTLYLRIGKQYPLCYLAAYVDQTKGFWNAGYDYNCLQNNIISNKLGFKQTPLLPLANVFADGMGFLLSSETLISFLRCTGFYFWILLALIFYRWRNCRDGLWEAIFLFLLMGTLLIATPVFSQLRYAYPLYTILPFLICAGNIGSSKK